jgi:hypothetical protein
LQEHFLKFHWNSGVSAARRIIQRLGYLGFSAAIFFLFLGIFPSAIGRLKPAGDGGQAARAAV